MAYFDFRNIGMEPRDKRVYEALYKLDRGSVRAIAEVTGLNRGTVHDVVKKLTDAGLATFVEVGPRRYYTASPPESLVSLVRERRDLMQNLEDVAAEYAAKLESRSEVEGAGGFATYYEGQEGIGAILYDVIRTVSQLNIKEYFAISTQRISSLLDKDFETFVRQRDKEGIVAKIITDTPIRGKLLLGEHRQMKFGRLNSDVIIYGDKTAIVSVDRANIPAAVVIVDQRVAGTQRLLFDQLWISASK